MIDFVQVDAGVSDAILAQWKCGFAQADKVDIILSALCRSAHHNVIGSNGNCLKGVLALSPWGLSAAIWNFVVLLRHHCGCRLTQNFKTASNKDDQVCIFHISW
jgi:hypothetical protein